jgi:uncharacterized Fe-S cluster-containing MiaB family protein
MGMGLPYLVYKTLALLVVVWPTVERTRNAVAWSLLDYLDGKDNRAVRQLKQCPGCAELIQKESRICCFCEYRFDAAASEGHRHGSPPGDL